MADSLTINSSTYAGELALPYINAAILSGDTLAKNYVTIKEGVKYKAVLKKLSNAASLVQSGTNCDFSQAGSLNLDESVLTVTDLKTNLELCKSEFARDWEAAQTGRGFINDVVPSNFADFLIGYAAAKVGENIEYTIWQGDTTVGSTYPSFNGFEKQINATAGTYYNATWTAGAMSASTVIANLNQLINNLPAALIGSPETKLYMNRQTAQYYRQAITALGYMQMYQASEGFNLQFNGYDIYVCPGMSAGTVIAAQPSNLFVGVDANSDFAEVKVVDMSLTDASDNVRMAMRYRVGVQVGVYQDVCFGSNS
jgi:hypothetical protein